MIDDSYVDTWRHQERLIVIAIVTLIWRHRTAYLTIGGSLGALDLHQNANVKWSYDLHRMAESHKAGGPRSRPDRCAIVVDRCDGINNAVIGIKMHVRGIDLHQMAESMANKKSTIEA